VRHCARFFALWWPHAIPSPVAEPSLKVKDNIYCAAEVIALTGYTRSSLTRKAADGSFPKPQGRTRVNTRMVNYYDKKEIDNWLASNRSTAATLLRNKEPMVVAKFNKAQMNSIRQASKALMCDVDTFSQEAILYKARFVLARIAEEGLD
jgi:predicted DNA-binding transcriptional regulator AlpA